MIKIFDDVLSDFESALIDLRISKLKWSYEYQPVTPPMIHKHWYSSGENFISELFEDLVGAIELKGLDRIKSSYLLAHTHGLEQQAHYDACDFTMIYYPAIDWEPEWGGGTVVGDTLVPYKHNRLVMFSCDQLSFVLFMFLT